MNTVIQNELDKIVVSISKIRSELSNIPVTWTGTLPNYGASTLQPTPVAPGVSDTGLVRLEDSDYIEVHTGPDNCYITREFKDVLMLLMKKNFEEFPDREFKRLYISAAGRQDGVDATGLHGGGKAVDAHYFTFGEPLFDIAERVTSMFNLKRQLSFVKDFIAAFPKPIIYLNDRIYFVMLGTDIGRTIKDYLHPAGGHDDHIHLGYK